MITTDRKTIRVAFQGEPGAFSEAAAIQLLGESITTVPRATFEAIFRSIAEGTADAILAPVENSLAGSGVGGFGLLLGRRPSPNGRGAGRGRGGSLGGAGPFKKKKKTDRSSVCM